MKLEQLCYFLEAAKHQHLGKASKVLAISPSAISHSIAALQEELGQNLFVKKGKNLVLTHQGKLLKARATKILEEIHHMREDLVSDNQPLVGHYSIAANQFLCAKFLTPAWVELQNQNFDLIADIYSMPSATVLSSTALGIYDFGLCFSPQSHPDVQIETLHMGQLKIVTRKDHPLQRFSKPFEKIKDYRASLPKPLQGIEVCESNAAFKKFDIFPNPDCFTGSYEVAAYKIGHSNSWGLFPDIVIDHYADSLSAIKHPRTWNAPYSIAAIWAKQRPPDRTIRTLLEKISQPFGPNR